MSGTNLLALLAGLAAVTPICAQTVNLTVSGLPAGTSGVMVIVDQGGAPYPYAVHQAASAGTATVSVAVIVGGPFRLRAASYTTQGGLSGLTASGQVTTGTVAAGQTIAASVGLTPLSVSLDASTPLSVARGSAFTAKVNCADAGDILSGMRTDFLTGPDGASGTGYLGSGTWSATGVGAYQAALTATSPLTGSVFSLRAATFFVSFADTSIYFFLPGGDRAATPWTFSLYSAGSVQVSVSGVPSNATSVAILADGAGLPSPGAMQQGFTPGSPPATITFDLAPGGPYRLRAVAFVNNGSVSPVLASGKAAAVTVPSGSVAGAAIALSPLSVALDPSTPTTAPRNSAVTLKANATDAGDILEGRRGDFLTDTDGASGVGYFGTSAWTKSGAAYSASVNAALPASGVFFAYKLTTPVYTMNQESPPVGLTLFAPSLDRYGAPWNLAFAGACSFTISPLSASPAGTGGSGFVSVTASDPACAWTASTQSRWLPLNTVLPVTGSGTLSYTVPANPSSQSRTASVAVAGLTHTVTQGGSACSFTIGPTAATAPPGGGTGTVAVAASLPDCTSTAASNAPWLTVTAGASGTGNYTVTYTADINATGGQRTGTLSIAGQTFVVTQDTGLAISLSTSNLTFNYLAGGSFPAGQTVTVTSAPNSISGLGLSASTSSGGSWMVLTIDQTSTPANITVSLRQGLVAALAPGSYAGTATVTAPGAANSPLSFTITLNVATCFYTVTPSPIPQVSYLGESRAASVAAVGSSCNWSASTSDPSMISFPGGAAGSGSAGLSYTVSRNPTAATRAAILTVAGQSFTVTQDASPALALSASVIGFSYMPGGATPPAQTVTATSTPVSAAGLAVSANAPWLTASLNSGATPATITASLVPAVLSQLTPGTYAGTVSLASTTAGNSPAAFTVSLAVGGGCTFSVTLSSTAQAAYAGESRTASIATQAGCNWSASASDPSMIVFPSGASGMGSATLNFSIARNPTAAARSAALTAAGQNFTITQAASPAISLSASSVSFSSFVGGAAPAAQTVNITSTPSIGGLTVAASTNTGGGWLTASLNTAVTPATLTIGLVSGVLAGLAAGNYAGAVSLTSGEAGNSPQSIAVSLSVSQCSIAVSLSSTAQVAYGGESRAATITAASGCAWGASASDSSMIAFPSGASGSGNGTLAYTISRNPSIAVRSATLTIAGQNFTVTQAASPTLTLSPTSLAFTYSSGGGLPAPRTVAVNSSPVSVSGVAVSANVNWMTASVNSAATPATITVALAQAVVQSMAAGSYSGTVTVTSAQAGNSPLAFSVSLAIVSCSYTVSLSSSANVPYGGASRSAVVTTQAGCPYTASTSNAQMISFPSGTSGTGSGSIAFNIAANPTTSARTANIFVASQVFGVTQDASPAIALSASSVNFSYLSGGSVPASQTINVTSVVQVTGISISANQSWLTASINQTSTPAVVTVGLNSAALGSLGAGNYSGAVSVASAQAANSPQTISVSLTISPCTYTVTPASIAAIAYGGESRTSSIATQAGCAWSASTTDATMIAFPGGNTGNGSGSLAFAVGANPGITGRSATLTIAGQAFAVTQPGSPALAAAPASVTFNYSIGAGLPGGQTASITSSPVNIGGLTASSNASWLAASVNPTTTPATLTMSLNQTAVNALSPGTYSAAATVTGSGAGNVVQVSVTLAIANCTYTITPSPIPQVASAGETRTATITAQAGCPWSASANSAMVAFPGATSGSGNGTVTYTVSANTAASPRSATLTIAGQSLTVPQAAAPILLAAAPSTLSFSGTANGSAPASQTASITASPAAASGLVASSPAAWLTLSLNQTTTPATLTIGIDATGLAAGNYSATVSVSGGGAANSPQQIAVSLTLGSCTYTVTPASITQIAAAGESRTASIATQSGCAWAASASNTSMISFPSGASGTGNGALNYAVSANTGAARSATLVIAGQSFAVTQAAPAPALSLSANSASFSMTSGGALSAAQTVSVTSSPAAVSGLTASSSATWLTASLSGVTTPATVTLAVNTGANSLAAGNYSGTVTVAAAAASNSPLTVAVSFTVGACSYSVTPATITQIAAGGETRTAAVATTAGCAWSASTSDAQVITFPSGNSGAGSGSLSYAVSANATAAGRNATLVIAGQSFSVTQAVAPTTIAATPASLSFTIPGSGTLPSPQTAALTGGPAPITSLGVTPSANWFTASLNASTAPATLTVSLNSAASALAAGNYSAKVTISGSGASNLPFDIPVTLNNGTCAYTVTPATISAIAAAGESRTATITAPAPCGWSASTTNSSLITFPGGSSGSGNGALAYTVAANNTTAARSATLTIAGQAFTVNQLAPVPVLNLAPASASFTAVQGGTLPAAQSIAVTASPINASGLAVSASASWLSASLNTTSTPATLTLSLDGPSVAALSSGNYSANATVSAAGAASQQVAVSFTLGVCTYTVSPATVTTIAAAGETRTAAITTQNGCAWSASASDTSMIAFPSGSTGTSSGTLTYTVNANPGAGTRTATLIAAGQSLAIAQSAAATNLSVAPATLSFVLGVGAALPSAQTASVTASPGAATGLTLSAPPSWLAVSLNTTTTPATLTANLTSAASSLAAGSYSASISVSAAVAANSPLTLTINLTVQSCSYSVSLSSTSQASALGEVRTASVTAPAGCTWTASANPANTITFPSGAGGSGAMALPYLVVANPTTSSRSATLTVAGQPFSVSQAPGGAPAVPDPDQFNPLQPFQGLGASQTFTFNFHDANGWSDIVKASVNFNVSQASSNACYLEVLPQTNQIRLFLDDGVSQTATANFPSSGTIENSQCSIALSGVQLTVLASDKFAVAVPITFKPSFQGRQLIFMRAFDQNNQTWPEWLMEGAWWPGAFSSALTPRYRLFSNFTHAHLYTTDLNEYQVLGTRGWIQEGISGSILSGPGAVGNVPGVPYYRIYFVKDFTHFWTADRNEYLTLNRYYGIYRGENIDGYLFTSPPSGGVPLYRLLYPYSPPVIHHWTTDANEHTVLSASGWISEGIAGYLVK